MKILRFHSALSISVSDSVTADTLRARALSWIAVACLTHPLILLSLRSALLLPAVARCCVCCCCCCVLGFDRNHLVRTSYYRDLVFGSYRFMRSAAFIEDTFGQLQLNMLRDSYKGAKHHRRHPFSHYASFLYYPANGLVSFVDHAHGRKYMTDVQRNMRYGARDQQEQEKIARRAERAGGAKARAAAEAAQGGAAAEAEEEDLTIPDIWND